MGVMSADGPRAGVSRQPVGGKHLLPQPEVAGTGVFSFQGKRSIDGAIPLSYVLRNEAEYTAAVAEIERLLDTDPSPHSESYERLEFLSVLVQAYEDAHFPLEQLTTPQDVVAFMLEQKGLSHDDLAP